jgi:NH3-dependent NAD+ synthetase
MTLKFRKGIFTCEKTVINRLLDFCNVLNNFVALEPTCDLLRHNEACGHSDKLVPMLA